MQPNIYKAVLFFAIFFLTCTTITSAQSCCPLPDSLSVTQVTDSSFCIKWKVKDSAACNNPYGAILVYRPTTSTNWTTKRIKYDSVTKFYSYCDTLTGCLKYQWRLRNVCIQNGDTTFTEYMKGPNFNAGCDTLMVAKKIQSGANGSVQIFPNPVKHTINLTGAFAGAARVKLTVTDLQGVIKIQKVVSVQNKKFRESIDAAALKQGAYFLTISDGTRFIKQSFIKE